MASPATPAVAGRARRRPVFHPLRVAAVQPLCEDAAALTLQVPEELSEEFAFAPGQAITLRRQAEGREERRSYSVCAPVGGPLRIGVRVVPGGLFSTWLVRGVRPGDTVEVMPPTGLFTPDLDQPGHHVLIAAGAGITPVLSIAASVLAAAATSQVTLLYGNRRTGTVMFAEELADLKDRYPDRFQLVHVLSREPHEADLLSGRLDALRLTALLRRLVDVAGTDHWWLCGPHGMVRAARQVLAGFEVPDDRVHRELFHAEDAAPPEPPHRPEAAADTPTSRVTVILDGRTTRAALPRDRSVLDGAQRVRPDLPFACKGGVCGTCRALLVDGEVRMDRNYALEPDELAAGYILTCQSVPVADEVTINYDS